jgi:hypothetical protein
VFLKQFMFQLGIDFSNFSDRVRVVSYFITKKRKEVINGQKSY